jgi:tetratricopeptide (TPR) repeat protein
MIQKIPYITLIEAPFGYGKTFNVNKLSSIYKVLKINYLHQNDNFINSLISSFHINKFDCPISSQLTDWFKYFKSLKHELILVFDDFDKINDYKAIEFINFFISNTTSNIYFIISSSVKLNLDENIALLHNCKYLNQNNLIFNDVSTKELWNEHKLKFSKNDLDFLHKSNGWSIAISLYLQFRKNQITSEQFNSLINQSIKNLFKDINNIFSDKNNILLERNLIEKKYLSDLVFEHIAIENKNYFEYWLYISLFKSNSVEQSIIYLQRALKICLSNKKKNEILKIYNRLINFYTINSEYKNIDSIIIQAENYITFSNQSDLSVYMYLKANRMRQINNYDESIKLLEYIINIDDDAPILLKFQTKSYVLYGLIEYQKGNYSLTRNYYQKAIYLAEGEKNVVLKTEIEIMLAFLDTWEGKNINILNESIIDIVDSFSLKDQPMMWLNLAFYWILGEKINIDFVELILNKIETINKTLNFNFLIPLIADIKARLLRFKGEYESAFYYHKIALNNLEINSFEYIHAQLNMGLSLIKISNNKEAENLINNVYKNAIKSNSLGLAKEAEILLRQINPNTNIDNKDIQKNQISSNHSNTIEEKIEINNEISFEFLGAFNVFINQKNVKWSRKKAKNLIIHLLLTPKGIHREYLAEILFPDDDNPLKNLDVHIHFIRKIFDKDKNKDNSIIMFQNSSYFFNKNFIYKSDIEDFKKLYINFTKEYNEDSRKTLALKIIDIYKGDFLPEIDFADYWIAERESYRKKIIEVLIFLLHQPIEDNIDYLCQKLIVIDPLNENNYILVMKKISDNKQLLKNTYKKYIEIMKNELSIEVNENVVNLYNELLKN